MGPFLLFGAGLLVAAFARLGWAVTVLVVVLAVAGTGLLVGIYWWVDRRRHTEDDQGWRLSAITLWITSGGERRTGRGHIGIQGVRWEPRLERDGGSPFLLPWDAIESASVGRKAPLTSTLQITTLTHETINLVVQAGPSTVRKAMAPRSDP